jgi:hypothetical protein
VLDMITRYMDSQYVDGQTFSLWKMVEDSHSSKMYVWIRRIVIVSHGVASSIYWNSYSSRTYVQSRRIILVYHSTCSIIIIIIITIIIIW